MSWINDKINFIRMENFEMGLLKDFGDRISGRHAEKMQEQQLAADQQEKEAERAAQAEADRLHYENEEKKRNAAAREEAQKRESQERIEIAKAKAEADKARSEAEVIQAENDLKIALAQKQVEATEKEQEGLSNRTRIEEDAETERTRIKELSKQAQVQSQSELEKVLAKEETLQTKITSERDIEIAKSADEASVRIREQQRLENQFLETEITRRGELTLEYMKEQLKMLDKERERKHQEFEKLIDSTRQKQKELQESFDKTGNIELIEQISDCETTLKQYIAKDKRDEKEYNTNKLIMNEKMNQLFITSDSGDDE